MSNLKDTITKKRLIVLGSVILLTLVYYFTSLYYVRVDPDTKNIVFFHWLFGSVIDPFWIDFWQYIWQFSMAFLLYLVVPMLIVKYYFKETQKDYGWQWGDKKFNLIWLMIGLAIIPVIFLVSNDPAIIHEYPLTKIVVGNLGLLLIFNVVYLIYYVGYEYIYRAYLQFGLKTEDLGKLGIITIIATQTIITTLFHIGKPTMEIIAAAAVGPLSGYLTLRGKSIIIPVLVFHYALGVIMNFAAIYYAA